MKLLYLAAEPCELGTLVAGEFTFRPLAGIAQVAKDLEMAERELVLLDAGYGAGTGRAQAP